MGKEVFYRLLNATVTKQIELKRCNNVGNISGSHSSEKVPVEMASLYAYAFTSLLLCDGFFLILLWVRI